MAHANTLLNACQCLARPRRRMPLLTLLALLCGGGTAKTVFGDQTRGFPWRGESGVVETVSQIMARESNSPSANPVNYRATRTLPTRKFLRANPSPPAKGIAGLTARASDSSSLSSFSIGASFLGAQLSESGSIPPDSQAAPGPSQVLLCVNGRLKVFSKEGVLGALNTTPNNFFNSRTHSATTDPHLRYDRLSGRWFVIMVDDPANQRNNQVLIAVSSGDTITNSTSFTFFSFNHNSVSGGGDNGFFADYPTLGIDNQALYIGANMFDGNNFAGTSGYVVNKSNLLSGVLTVTAFRQLATSTGPGPSTPQGVDNDDPLATTGYFIGVDNVSHGLLVLRRITDPGGTPSISEDLDLAVPDTAPPTNGVPVLGSTIRLDALDDRLFAARMHHGSLWTAHNLQINATGEADPNGDRVGSRWYEITNLTEAAGLRQSGTLFDPSPANPANYWIPSCSVNGQGNMVLACSVGGVTEHAEIAYAGRLATDPLGTLQEPRLAQISTTTYNVGDGVIPHRWGDFSLTTVDPTDDMTFWTAQEYCNANNSWGVRIIQIRPPPPATILTCNPSTLPAGTDHALVMVAGVSTNGSGFFEPGPGFSNHLSATVSGSGITVKGVTFIDSTQIALDLTVAPDATGGPRQLRLINPDGQVMASSSGIFAVLSPPEASATVLADGSVSLTWTASAGTQYRVQYKSNLTEVTWTDLPGDVTANGITAGKSDPLGIGQRFYRVMVLP